MPVKKAPTPAVKVATPAAKAATPAAKKSAAADSSDDDDVPVKKPTSSKIASDSDDDNAPLRSVDRQPKRPRDNEGDEDEDDDDEKPKRTLRPSGGIAKPDASSSGAQQTFNRFQRIDPAKVDFYHDRLKDNRPGQEAIAFRQNQEMMKVRGKEFNKHKQKNKGKLYAAGVDQSCRSFKFDE